MPARRGAKHHNARLTKFQVMELVKLRGQGWSYGLLAERYRVSRATVQTVCEGRSWSQVTGIVRRRA